MAVTAIIVAADKVKASKDIKVKVVKIKVRRAAKIARAAKVKASRAAEQAKVIKAKIAQAAKVVVIKAKIAAADKVDIKVKTVQPLAQEQARPAHQEKLHKKNSKIKSAKQWLGWVQEPAENAKKYAATNAT